MPIQSAIQKVFNTCDRYIHTQLFITHPVVSYKIYAIDTSETMNVAIYNHDQISIYVYNSAMWYGFRNNILRNLHISIYKYMQIKKYWCFCIVTEN